MKEEIIDIKEQVIELLENKRYSNLHNYIDKLNSQDISQLFEELSKEDMALVFRLLAKDEAADRDSDRRVRRLQRDRHHGGYHRAGRRRH